MDRPISATVRAGRRYRPTRSSDGGAAGLWKFGSAYSMRAPYPSVATISGSRLPLSIGVPTRISRRTTRMPAKRLDNLAFRPTPCCLRRSVPCPADPGIAANPKSSGPNSAKSWRHCSREDPPSTRAERPLAIGRPILQHNLDLLGKHLEHFIERDLELFNRGWDFQFL